MALRGDHLVGRKIPTFVESGSASSLLGSGTMKCEAGGACTITPHSATRTTPMPRRLLQAYRPGAATGPVHWRGPSRLCAVQTRCPRTCPRVCLVSFERPIDARNESLTCLRINSRDPMNWLIRLQLGTGYCYEGDHDMAETGWTPPNRPEVHFRLAAALASLVG
jgi:hypothetical protein